MNVFFNSDFPSLSLKFISSNQGFNQKSVPGFHKNSLSEISHINLFLKIIFTEV